MWLPDDVPQHLGHFASLASLACSVHGLHKIREAARNTEQRARTYCLDLRGSRDGSETDGAASGSLRFPAVAHLPFSPSSWMTCIASAARGSPQGQAQRAGSRAPSHVRSAPSKVNGGLLRINHVQSDSLRTNTLRERRYLVVEWLAVDGLHVRNLH